MAHSDEDTITIVDESKDSIVSHRLLIDGNERALLTQSKGGEVKINWLAKGPFHLQESKVWAEGLLELTLLGDQLEAGHARSKK